MLQIKNNNPEVQSAIYVSTTVCFAGLQPESNAKETKL
jgi:hypothetical protein